MAQTRWVVVSPDSKTPRIAPIHRRIVAGRECISVPSEQRLVIDDPLVSRDHLELRLERSGATSLIDTSTNGTRLNGMRVARGQATELNDGDRIELGNTLLQFRSLEQSTEAETALRSTIRELEAGRLTQVVDDPLKELTGRERQILALIAQGFSNSAIAERLVLSLRTVEAHIRNIMLQLRLPESPDDNRRVHAVLTYLRAVSVTAQAESP